MNGILTTLLVMSPLNMGQMIQDIRNWESEKDRTPIEQMLDESLMDVWDDIETDIDSTDTNTLMLDSTESTDSLLREVVGDDKNDKKRQVVITEDEEWLRHQTTGGGAET